MGWSEEPGLGSRESGIGNRESLSIAKH
ncbi:hypothetical protein ACCQ14_16280 [Xanthomonas sp. NCPPB 2865]